MLAIKNDYFIKFGCVGKATTRYLPPARRPDTAAGEVLRQPPSVYNGRCLSVHLSRQVWPRVKTLQWGAKRAALGIASVWLRRGEGLLSQTRCLPLGVLDFTFHAQVTPGGRAAACDLQGISGRPACTALVVR